GADVGDRGLALIGLDGGIGALLLLLLPLRLGGLLGHDGAPTPALSGCLTSASSPGMITCRSPGTPNSYGPPTTRGISSKLKIGGGEETSHSIVFERHGFPGAFGP